MDLYTPAYKPTGEEVAVIETSQGTIRVALAGKDAPIHVGNFIELASKGYYDGLKFHRYVPGFVIQGGCPFSREMSAQDIREGSPFSRVGTGGPGYNIAQEFSVNPNNKHLDGTLAMARSQGYDTAGSQFYLCLGPQPFLDPEYTVFGQTVDGLDVVHKLRMGDIIESITIENADAAQLPG